MIRRQFLCLLGGAYGALGSLALPGCTTTPPARLYVLTPLASVEPVPPAPGSRSLSLGIGPVELPQYVNRPQIVTGQDAPELQRAAVAEWAEPLQHGVMRVLAENLSRLLGTERVALFPWKSFVPEYQVVIDVTQFLGQPGGDVTLVALWSILRQRGKEPLVSKKSRFRETTGSVAYDALAAAMSRTLAALSREMATTLMTLPL